jgi:peptidoglycan/xylan/chitin deacetylase (PgdA/CDA1 family)
MPMGNEEKILDVLRQHGVPFVFIGGYTVNMLNKKCN